MTLVINGMGVPGVDKNDRSFVFVGGRSPAGRSEVLAKKVSLDAAGLGDPDHAAWSGAEAHDVQLAPTPMELQPSAYLAATRRARPVGVVQHLRVRSLHNGSDVAFHLEWQDPARAVALSDNDVFPDGAALLFPLREDAPLMTMGSEDRPVAAWHWRADRPERARANVSEGLGTTRVLDDASIATAASWRDGRWRLVFRRALRPADATSESIPIGVGETLKVAFAVWEGGNGERGGLKSFSPSWHLVTLES
jgi:DMSO reductase family type II enzyme heme b subunit